VETAVFGGVRRVATKAVLLPELVAYLSNRLIAAIHAFPMRLFNSDSATMSNTSRGRMQLKLSFAVGNDSAFFS
jgi:hypothetical protein